MNKAEHINGSMCLRINLHLQSAGQSPIGQLELRNSLWTRSMGGHYERYRKFYRAGNAREEGKPL